MLENSPQCVALTEPSPCAALVLVEPGAAGLSELRASAEQNHVLALGTGEAYASFSERAEQRAHALARRPLRLLHVTYLVGTEQGGNWCQRQALLAELSHAVDPQGTLTVHAPAHMRLEVLGCLGALQHSSAGKLNWHFVFGPEEPGRRAPRSFARSKGNHDLSKNL